MPIVGTNSYSIKYHRRHHASFPLRRRFATLTLSLPSAAARDAPDALRLAHCMALFTSVFKTETNTESARWDVQGIAPECANLFTHSCDYNPPLRHIHLAPRLPATLNSGHLASGSRASAAPRELQLRLRHLTPHLSVCHSSTPITRSSTEKGGNNRSMVPLSSACIYAFTNAYATKVVVPRCALTDIQAPGIMNEVFAVAAAEGGIASHLSKHYYAKVALGLVRLDPPRWLFAYGFCRALTSLRDVTTSWIRNGERGRRRFHLLISSSISSPFDHRPEKTQTRDVRVVSTFAVRDGQRIHDLKGRACAVSEQDAVPMPCRKGLRRWRAEWADASRSGCTASDLLRSHMGK
ncbi:hypothetical protein C8J57DRAFT_1466176 [Mycena rebaudengoi]|nr:hypothetical protein C8J57DRAFT_1466176 [Mycena rebaudengoi]